MDDTRPKCVKCGEAINMRHNNYRVVGLRVDPLWAQPGQKPEPPQSLYKHKFCMDPDEWKTDDATTAQP